MKILITGGLGFIGSNLIEYLIKKKSIKKIIIVDNFSKSSTRYLDLITKYKYHSSSKKYKNSSNRVQLIKADVTDINFAKLITRNIDYVVHLAAESGVDISISKPLESFNTNVIGAYNYLESSRVNKVKRFVLHLVEQFLVTLATTQRIKY